MLNIKDKGKLLQIIKRCERIERRIQIYLEEGLFNRLAISTDELLQD